MKEASEQSVKDRLLANRVKGTTGTIELPGIGTITFRPLSRAQMREVNEKAPDDGFLQERYVLAAALVDPQMTPEEVAVWQDNSPAGEINAVAMAINKLSGIGPNAAKEQYKSV